MNIPNLLTLCRIILVPVFVIFLIDGAFGKALVVFLAASITDGLDGFLARVLKQKTILGAYMDPLADKALVITSFVTLSVLDAIPSWLAVIVISRDFVILFGICVLSLMSIPFEVRPAFVSKITTVFQFLTVFFVLAFEVVPKHHDASVMFLLYWGTAFLTIVSGFTYIKRGIELINHSH